LVRLGGIVAVRPGWKYTPTMISAATDKEMAGNSIAVTSEFCIEAWCRSMCIKEKAICAKVRLESRQHMLDT